MITPFFQYFKWVMTPASYNLKKKAHHFVLWKKEYLIFRSITLFSQTRICNNRQHDVWIVEFRFATWVVLWAT